MQTRRDIENQRCHLYHIPDELFAAAHLRGTRTFPKRCARMADSAVPSDFTKIPSGPDDIPLPAASRKLQSVVGAKVGSLYEAFVEDTKRLNPDWRSYRDVDQVVLPGVMVGSISAKADQRSRERVLSVLMVTASLIGSADSEAQKAEVREIAQDVCGLANTLDSQGLMKLLCGIQHIVRVVPLP